MLSENEIIYFFPDFGYITGESAYINATLLVLYVVKRLLKLVLRNRFFHYRMFETQMRYI